MPLRRRRNRCTKDLVSINARWPRDTKPTRSAQPLKQPTPRHRQALSVQGAHLPRRRNRPRLKELIQHFRTDAADFVRPTTPELATDGLTTCLTSCAPRNSDRSRFTSAGQAAPMEPTQVRGEDGPASTMPISWSRSTSACAALRESLTSTMPGPQASSGCHQRLAQTALGTGPRSYGQLLARNCLSPPEVVRPRASSDWPLRSLKARYRL